MHSLPPSFPLRPGSLSGAAALAALALSGLCVHSAHAAAPPPNVIVILADDIGYGEVSCYGQQRYQTPQIDALAQEGMKFTDFYAGAPECAPSRDCLMTGMHPGHARIRANFSYDGSGSQKRVGMTAEDNSLGRLMQSAGYATACIGKWGLGEEGTDGVPWKQGFDTFYGFVNQTHAHNYYPEFIYDGPEKVALPGNYGFADKLYIHDAFTDQALAYVDQHKNKPFFLYLAYTLPHGKLTAPDDELLHQPLNLSDGYPAGKVAGSSPVFAAMLRRFDRDVGRLMQRLKEDGIDGRTLVIFTSDNGPAHLGPTADDTVDVDFFKASGPLRGEKSDVYDGGIRVPLIARWPGHIAPATVNHDPFAFWDFLPTFAELAHATAPASDGLSFLPALLGRPQPQHDFLYWEFISKGQPRIAVREGKWKLDRYGLKGPWELYDLEHDIGESRNLAQDHPEDLKRLIAIAKKAHVDSPDFPLVEKKEEDHRPLTPPESP